MLNFLLHHFNKFIFSLIVSGDAKRIDVKEYLYLNILIFLHIVVFSCIKSNQYQLQQIIRKIQPMKNLKAIMYQIISKYFIPYISMHVFSICLLFTVQAKIAFVLLFTYQFPWLLWSNNELPKIVKCVNLISTRSLKTKSAWTLAPNHVCIRFIYGYLVSYFGSLRWLAAAL